MSGTIGSAEGRQTLSQERLLTVLRLLLGLSAATGISLIGDMPVWVAMLGVVAYFSRGKSLQAGAYNLACAVTGLGLGLAAQAAVAKWQLQPQVAALPIALLVAAVGAWAMGLVTGVSNISSYAIGILIGFAAQVEVSLDNYFILIAAMSIGAVVGGLVDRLWPGRRALGS
ncbi:DUF1097 domain-containing protein [Microbulbifer sp. GL-2]|uniref:DUF1097 domain-containing protein n=1 Tax=Microbulbifer sp. GL-2 TaxID=2591606 RepID=UPI00155B23A5|nr:DUF1097 domain-containing protein [Microbulbifer sp. GL-2]